MLKVFRLISSSLYVLKNLTASQLTEFKRVKDYFGRTEITTISQAAAINATGKYEIGNVGITEKFTVSITLAVLSIVERVDSE